MAATEIDDFGHVDGTAAADGDHGVGVRTAKLRYGPAYVLARRIRRELTEVNDPTLRQERLDGGPGARGGERTFSRHEEHGSGP